MKTKHLTTCVFMLVLAANPSVAEPPNVQTSSPVIHLADNLDKEDNLGWCINTFGRGLSDQLQAHSCKPQGGDVQLRYDKVSGQIASVAFDEKCAEHLGSGQQLQLLDCDPARGSQKFSYDQKMMAFHPLEDPGSCLTIGEKSRSAGPFMSRDLLIADCSEAAQAFQSWVTRP